jgi:hypothetical protein
VTAMANLATANSAERETAATLTKAITTITDQLAEIYLGQVKRSRDQTQSYRTNNDSQCWSHGYQVGMAHTSDNCTRKPTGNKDESIKDNNKGCDTWEETLFDEVGTFR